MSTQVCPIDMRKVRREWQLRGFGCEERIGYPDDGWFDRLHETDELFLLLEGEVEIEVNGEAIRPSQGDEILIPASSYHVLRNLGDVPARWLHGLQMDIAQTD